MQSPSTETIRLDSDYAANDTIAERYRIVRMLGSGGMGTVYLAEDRDAASLVALKVIRPEHGSPESADRFEREGEILAKLNHPNIARFLDSGTTADGLPFLAMEFVDGVPIDDYCDQKQLDVSDRFAVFQSLCGAVQHLHLQGVIHRDLKPSNILVTREGVIKLLDFGIAKQVHPIPQGLTRSGLRLMTPEYASPEQIRAEPVTPLSDIYSLGVVLYELVTGHRPYRLQSRILHEIMRAICEDRPEAPSVAVTRTETQPDGRSITPAEVSRLRKTSPEKLKKRLTGEVDAILLKAMAKDPRDRYWSADQLATDLSAHLSHGPLLAEPASRRTDALLQMAQRHAWVLLAGCVGAVLIATGSVHINHTGFAILGSSAGLAILWRFVSRPAVAQRIADNPFAGLFSPHHLGLAMIAFLFFLGFLIGLFEGVTHRRLNQEKAVDLLPWESTALVILEWGDGFMLAGFSLMLLTAFTNLSRLRWAGNPLAVFHTPSLSRGFGCFMGAACAIGGSVSLLLRSFEWLTFLMSVLAAFLFWWSWRYTGKLEMRERGIVSHGAVWQWREITGFSVQPSGLDTDYFVLRIEVRRAFKFLPPVRHELHQSQVAPAEHLLQAMLSPWPGATIG